MENKEQNNLQENKYLKLTDTKDLQSFLKNFKNIFKTNYSWDKEIEKKFEEFSEKRSETIEETKNNLIELKNSLEDKNLNKTLLEVVNQTINFIWEEKNEESQINKKENFQSIELTKKEFHNFTTMIFAEAWWEWLKWQIAVWYSILNRVKFWQKDMNTILFQKWQFSPTIDGRFEKIKNTIWEKEKDIAKKILNWEFENPIWNATFFQTKWVENWKWKNWQRTANTLDHKNKIIIWNHIFRTEKQYA